MGTRHEAENGLRRRGLAISLGVLPFVLWALMIAETAAATVTTATFADVSGRGFSVVWASSEPVIDATVRVFSDPAGTTELTSGLSIAVASAALPAAFAVGVVRVDVAGLTPGTCVSVQTVTTASGVVSEPPTPDYPEVCTSDAASRAALVP